MTWRELLQSLPASVNLEMNSGALVVVLAVLVMVLVGAGAFAYFLLYCEKFFKRLYSRPKPLPQIDRAPTQIDQTTITGRGRNWFYSYRREWINVRMGSFDGTWLSAYYRPSTDPGCRNMVILVHAYDEEPTEVAAYAKLLMKKISCHVLITHMRGHGMSGGKSFTWGLRESVDLDCWFEFTRRRLGPYCRIYIFGRGVGATAALLAAQQKGFCPEVCGIIADSPVDTLPSFLRNVMSRDKFISTEAALYRLRMMTKARFGFDMNVCDCKVHAGRIRVPVLLFAGGEDDETLPRGINDIYDNLRCRKRMVVINDARHLMCYENSQALYEREVQKFIESCLIRLVKLGRL